MASFDKLITSADRATRLLSGLVSILLTIRVHKGDDVKWDASTARFTVNGKVIPYNAIQDELSRLQDRLAAIVILYNINLFSGKWTIKTWRTEMEKLVTDHHIIFAALAIGSLALAIRNPTVKRRTTRDLKALDGYVKVLATQLHTKKPKDSTDLVKEKSKANARSKTYIRSLYVTFHLISQRAHIDAGHTEGRRRLSPAEHCRTESEVEGCLEAAARGWMPIRQVPPIGTLVCRQFCKCRVEYR